MGKASLGRIGARIRSRTAICAMNNGSPDHVTDDGSHAPTRAAIQPGFLVEFDDRATKTGQAS
jgi:hypothetical protein